MIAPDFDTTDTTESFLERVNMIGQIKLNSIMVVMNNIGYGPISLNREKEVKAIKTKI